MHRKFSVISLLLLWFTLSVHPGSYLFPNFVDDVCIHGHICSSPCIGAGYIWKRDKRLEASKLSYENKLNLFKSWSIDIMLTKIRHCLLLNTKEVRARFFFCSLAWSYFSTCNFFRSNTRAFFSKELIIELVIRINSNLFFCYRP